MLASFFELNAEHVVGKNNQLVQLKTMIQWDCCRHWLKGLHKNEITHEGNEAYDALSMFKAILLGQWHSLSDPALEQSLRTRLDFMLFTGFGLEGQIPDETTLCRFRNKLFQSGRAEKLFAEINRQLEVRGLSIRQAKGAIVDATVIESAARPNRVIEMAEDRNEAERESSSTNYQIQESKDPDARWLKKGRRVYFGYKGFVSVESERGFIQTLVMTPANRYEAHVLPELIKDLEPTYVMADKGYADSANRLHLYDRNIQDGIMRKALKNQPLSLAQKKMNRLISKIRFKVEQCFGTLKRRFLFSRATYFGIEKVKGQMFLKACCFNLLKGLNLEKVY